MADTAAPGATLLSLWRRLAGLPGGPLLFSVILGRRVPYTGSIRPRVEVLEPGFARVRMSDRPAVRNHLRSVHALALANLGEVTSGLAVLCGLPPGVRGIVTSLEARYHQKARGPLVAEARVVIPAVGATVEHQVVAEIRNSEGALVTEVLVQWRLSPT
jgi:acyl-coenzyme A thioesterase PaaI-like protein